MGAEVVKDVALFRDVPQPSPHWVTALERNNDKGAQKSFLVETNWSQFHFDTDGTRLNPYDKVPSGRVTIAQSVGHINLTQAELKKGVQKSTAAKASGKS